MSDHYGDIAFTEPVRDEQWCHGSRDAYARAAARRGGSAGPDALTGAEVGFLAERDGFYVASVGPTGWPYVQYRGGSPGFLRVLDAHTLGWADVRGNLQYISTGNLRSDDRVALFVMDYAHRRRLKIFGRARIVEAGSDPDLDGRLADPGDDSAAQHAVVVAVEAFDWNCPQHITPRFTEAELEPALRPLRDRLVALERENAQLRARIALGQDVSQDP